MGINVYTEELLTKCNKYGEIYIYGAGKYARRVYCFLKMNGIQVAGFLVSDQAGNPESLFGQPVVAVDKFADYSDRLIVVSVAIGSKAYREIFDCLLEKEIHHIFFVPKNLLAFIDEGRFLQSVRDSFNVGIYHLAEDAPVEIGHAILAMDGPNDAEYHWRVSVWNQYPSNMAKVFQRRSALEEFEGAYGKYHIFNTLKEVPNQDATYAIYMARSHVDKELGQSGSADWLIPIQVGAALTNCDICKVKDNTGENISERNGNYSECTALYWMWKNAPQTDYIGLCHYRRHFDLEENEIGMLAGSGLDVLATSPTFVNETVGVFFSTLIPKSDLQAMLVAIGKVRPEYLTASEKFLQGRFFPPCNLFIMKHSIFQEYAAFAFPVTFEIERFYDSRSFFRHDRYMGYLMECLLGIFLMKNKDRLRIGYTDMKFLC